MPTVKKKRKRKKNGRPTVWTDEVFQKLKQGFLMGFNPLEACAYAGIGKSTYYDYIKANPSFSDKIEAWQTNPILKAKRTLYNDLADVSTAKWLLERKAKGEFSPRVEQTGADGEAVQQQVTVVFKDLSAEDE